MKKCKVKSFTKCDLMRKLCFEEELLEYERVAANQCKDVELRKARLIKLAGKKELLQDMKEFIIYDW